MRKGLFIICCFCCLSMQAAPFKRTYKQAPLYVVLQDMEAHFGCSFLYRPQDVANAPTVTASFSTDDYAAVLRKALGAQLVYTKRKNILIISQAPKKEEESVPQSVVSDVTHSLVVTAPVDTVSEDSIQVEREYLPIEILRPGTRLAISPIDTIRIARLRIKEAVSIQHSEINRQKPIVSGQYLKHSFLTTLSLGYGSELQTDLSLQYIWSFLPHWGLSTGLNLTFAAQDSSLYWLGEGRIGIPLAVHTQWMFTPLWGVHANAGIAVAFPYPISSEHSMNGITNKNVDAIATAAVHAYHPIGQHTILLLGLYGNLSVTGLTPWSVGLQLGFQIGK